MSNEEVVKAFLARKEGESGTMKSTGTQLYSYKTVIAEHFPDGLWITEEKFSSATSRQVSLLRRLSS